MNNWAPQLHIQTMRSTEGVFATSALFIASHIQSKSQVQPVGTSSNTYFEGSRGAQTSSIIWRIRRVHRV